MVSDSSTLKFNLIITCTLISLFKTCNDDTKNKNFITGILLYVNSITSSVKYNSITFIYLGYTNRLSFLIQTAINSEG